MEIPFVEDFGKAFLPKKLRPHMRVYLERAGIYKSQYELIGYLFYISVFLSIGGVFMYVMPFIDKFATNFSFSIRTFVVLISAFISAASLMAILMTVFFLLGYFFVDIKVYKRTRQIEDVLPDFLAMVSTNLKGGMNLDQAMWNSIRPKFGVLSEEVALVSKKVMTGMDIAEALSDLMMKYDSPELKRTLSLITSELEVGGKISKIIDDIVVQLKETKKLKKKMVASVVSYMIFIGAITIFIAPVLFALSYHLISFIHSFISRVGGSFTSAQGVPSFLTNLNADAINPDNFRVFGLVAAGTIAVFSSMIVATIEKGDLKGGIKYIPVFLFGAVGVYLLAVKLLSLVLGGIII